MNSSLRAFYETYPDIAELIEAYALALDYPENESAQTNLANAKNICAEIFECTTFEDVLTEIRRYRLEDEAYANSMALRTRALEDIMTTSSGPLYLARDTRHDVD